MSAGPIIVLVQLVARVHLGEAHLKQRLARARLRARSTPPRELRGVAVLDGQVRVCDAGRLSMFVCMRCGRLEERAGFCSADGEQLVARDDELQGIALGSYRITRLIGRGGMGQVYQGVHPAIGSRVAIKVLSHECLEHPEFVQRFFDEARAVNFIRHENIVNVLDLAHLPDGRPYIVMEHLDGQTLRGLLTGQQATFDAVVAVIEEVLAALEAAHAKGIVHRDLKPDNIFVTPAGHAKVLDFGIAKLRPELTGQRAATRTGAVFGTPQYMSPEQALGSTVDARTDLYSMGVVLYESITGRRPFEGSTMYALLQKHVTEVPTPPSAHRSGVPPSLDQVVMRALAKDVKARFSSAKEFRVALAQVMQSSGLVRGSVGLAASTASPLSSPPLRTFQGGPGEGAGASSSAAAQRPSMSQPGVPDTGPPAYTQATTTAGGYTVLAGAVPPRGEPAKLGGVGYGLQSPAAGYGAPSSTGGYAAPPGGYPGAQASYAAAPVMTPAAGFGEPPTNHRPRPSSKLPLLMVLGCGGLGVVVAISLATLWLWSKRQVQAVSDAAEVVLSTTNTDGSDGADPEKPEVPVPPVAAESEPDTEAQASAAVDLKRFNISGYMPTAFALAKEEFSDAEFLRVDAMGVRPDGTVDVTARSENHVIYRFRSPSRSLPPADFPKNLEYSGPCIYYVMVMSSGVTSYVVDHWKCTEPTLPLPQCSVEQIWSRATQQGAQTGNVVGQIGYWADDQGKGRWLVMVPPGFSGFIPDRC